MKNRYYNRVTNTLWGAILRCVGYIGLGVYSVCEVINAVAIGFRGIKPGHRNHFTANTPLFSTVVYSFLLVGCVIAAIDIICRIAKKQYAPAKDDVLLKVRHSTFLTIIGLIALLLFTILSELFTTWFAYWYFDIFDFAIGFITLRTVIIPVFSLRQILPGRKQGRGQVVSFVTSYHCCSPCSFYVDKHGKISCVQRLD
ncbi:MAG: hypothetical protein IJC01_01060 [Clostridia bacterium]|nr:hypothetical protein [Clostridia bacterium]